MRNNDTASFFTFLKLSEPVNLVAVSERRYEQKSYCVARQRGSGSNRRRLEMDTVVVMLVDVVVK